jgi:hypothetical protein
VRRPTIVLFALVAALVSAGGDRASASGCSYPGDDADRAAIATWMGADAKDAGLPAELPVIAALTDSGLRNLPQEERTTAGYFQMRVDIWDKGDYAGFPDHPTLQLAWFIAQALAVRQKHVAAGDADYGSDPAHWGEWVADVQRPAEQYRGRYQLRLEDARSLIGSRCEPSPAEPPPAPPDPDTPPPPPDAQMVPESFLPRMTVTARRYQDAARSGRLLLTAACSNERCLARTAASIAVPGRGVFRVSLWPVQLARGQRQTFRVPLSTRVRKLVTAALKSRTCPLAAMRVVAANAGGYRSSMSRTVTLARSGRACD